MPNLNGFRATRSISKDPTTQQIPVILVTTKDQDTDRVRGMRQGAKAYITKPFSETDLADVINASIHTAQLLVTLGWIEVSERQSDKKHPTDNIACRAVEQVMQCIGESERPASENCH